MSTPELAAMMQQLQQQLQNPQVQQRLMDPNQRMMAAQHLAQQFPAPPPEIIQQMVPGGQPTVPAQQQPPPANPTPASSPAGGLGGMMLPGTPQMPAGQQLQMAGRGQNPFDGLK